MAICSDINNLINNLIQSYEGFGVYISVQGRCAYANKALISILQYLTHDEIIYTPIEMFYPQESLIRIEKVYQALISDLPVTPHLFSVAMRRDKTTINVILLNFKIEYFEKPAILTIMIDVSFEKNLTIRVPGGQERDTAEVLARGTAHEINNIVGIISGNLDMISMSVQKSPQAGVYIKQAADACRRGKELSRQLFRLAPRNTEEPISISIWSIVNAALQALNSSIPESICIRQETRVPPGGDIIQANPTHLMEMLVDLFSNAVQTMKDLRSTLDIELLEVDLDSDTAGSLASGLKPGEYLDLNISHTGEGMDPSLGSRIFDPYFPLGGKGGTTGLVFAVAAATMRSLAGTIVLNKDREQRCTFHLYFPRRQASPEKCPMDARQLPTGSGGILLIEGDETLADWGVNLLEILGYIPVLLSSFDDAFALLSCRAAAIDLVIADSGVLKEDLSGFVQKLKALRPNLSVILWIAGEDVDLAEGSAVHLLRKPTSEWEFATAVRNALCPSPDVP